MGEKLKKKTTSDLNDIVSCLLTVDPYRIVLFGSFAAETGGSESDGVQEASDLSWFGRLVKGHHNLFGGRRV